MITLSTACILVLVFISLARSLPPRRLIGIVLLLCLAWHWTHLYKTMWAAKHSTLLRSGSVPPECRPKEMTWWGIITYQIPDLPPVSHSWNPIIKWPFQASNNSKLRQVSLQLSGPLRRISQSKRRVAQSGRIIRWSGDHGRSCVWSQSPHRSGGSPHQASAPPTVQVTIVAKKHFNFNTFVIWSCCIISANI